MRELQNSAPVWEIAPPYKKRAPPLNGRARSCFMLLEVSRAASVDVLAVAFLAVFFGGGQASFRVAREAHEG